MIKYTKAYIGQLLDKYMAGTSTLEEEDILARYFRGKDVPQEWEDYRQLFLEIETMKPSAKPKHKWIGWSAAAAVAGIVILFATTQRLHREEPQTKPLIAKSDTTKAQQPKEPAIEQSPDTVSIRQMEVQPVHSKKRRLRKLEHTIHDYDKAYALMAQAQQAKAEADQVKAKLEMFNAQMAAYGYIPVMQEDGTIIYINEQENLMAYEE